MAGITSPGTGSVWRRQCPCFHLGASRLNLQSVQCSRNLPLHHDWYIHNCANEPHLVDLDRSLDLSDHWQLLLRQNGDDYLIRTLSLSSLNSLLYCLDGWYLALQPKCHTDDSLNVRDLWGGAPRSAALLNHAYRACLSILLRTAPAVTQQSSRFSGWSAPGFVPHSTRMLNLMNLHLLCTDWINGTCRCMTTGAA